MTWVFSMFCLLHVGLMDVVGEAFWYGFFRFGMLKR